MKIRQLNKLWTGFGSFTLAAAAVASSDAPTATSAFQPTVEPMQLAQGGEGGEAGESPSSYTLLSTDPQAYAFNVRPQVHNYAALVYDSYRQATAEAKKMQAAVEAFLQRPTAATLAQARQQWVAARPSYLVTEVFRFYDGPIDVAADGSPGPESRINAWPLNEAFIDYVKGQPASGLIGDVEVELTRASIMSRDQVSDEADVTTGWHAIEFLLWGQDFNDAGPGERPHTDYLPGDPVRERRRLYLQTVIAMLVDDLAALEAAWAPDADNYRRRFLALEPREALGRAVNGMANLVGHELATERLAVALDSGDQEDEHSCFSDTTHQDHLFDLRGARNIWFGSRGEQPAADGLGALVRKLDPAMAERTDDLLTQALAAVALMDRPFERVLRAEPGSEPRQRAEAAITALQQLGAQFGAVGRRLGVLVIVPGLDSAAG